MVWTARTDKTHNLLELQYIFIVWIQNFILEMSYIFAEMPVNCEFYRWWWRFFTRWYEYTLRKLGDGLTYNLSELYQSLCGFQCSLFWIPNEEQHLQCWAHLFLTSVGKQARKSSIFAPSSHALDLNGLLQPVIKGRVVYFWIFQLGQKNWEVQVGSVKCVKVIRDGFWETLWAIITSISWFDSLMKTWRWLIMRIA